MDNKRKAVLLVRMPAVSGATDLERRLGKFRKYAEENELVVAKEISGFEDCALHESGLFDKALDFIVAESEKITLLMYNDFFWGAESEIYKKYKNLLEQGKVELENYAHPCFPEPTNDQIKIWRYLTLPKFIDLLHSKTLFLTRADILRSDDKSEGAGLTNAARLAIEALEQIVKKDSALTLPDNPNLTVAELVDMTKRSDKAHEELLKTYFVNCWHMNEHENFAMWKVYSEPFGVCVQSTYNGLISSFNDEEYVFYRKKAKIYIGEVNYVDWDNYVIPSGNAFWPIMHKKREFTYERELRCVVWDFNKSIVKIGVDLERLIDKIYINPYTPAWFHGVIASLCTKYGVGAERVIQSSLM